MCRNIFTNFLFIKSFTPATRVILDIHVKDDPGVIVPLGKNDILVSDSLVYPPTRDRHSTSTFLIPSGRHAGDMTNDPFSSLSSTLP